MVDMKREVVSYGALLRALPFIRGLEFTPARPSTSDGTVTVTTPTRSFELPYELKRSHLSREQAELVIAQAKQLPGLLLLAPSISPGLGARLEEHHVNFMDAAGNCFLRLSDAYVARMQGRAPARVAPVDKGLRAPSYRVLFALLIDPDLLTASTRALAEASGGVSPQTAADLRARLITLQLVHQTKRSYRWAPESNKRLMELWLSGVGSTLYPGLLVARFRGPDTDLARLEARLAERLSALGSWAWGGGAAAQRLTDFYRGTNTVVFLGADVEPPSARALGLVQDPRGPIVLYRAPGPRAFREGADIVHPLLVYTDLLLEGEPRASEAAEEIHERFLSAEPRT
jgi:hypothetical protein